MSVFQLIYTSRATDKMTDAALLEILSRAQSKNDQRRLSGILVFHKGAFMQLLEGDEKEVKEIFAHIQQDTRHTEVTVVYAKENQARCMPAWFMGFSTSGAIIEAIKDHDFHIPIDETKHLCDLMEGEIGALFQSFLNS